MRTILSIIDSINYTTMPYNEFVIFRGKNYKQEKQIILQTGKQNILNDTPDSIRIFRIGLNPFSAFKTIKTLLSSFKKNGEEYIFHLHSLKGSLITLLVLFILGKRHYTVFTIHTTYSGYKFYNKILCFLDALFSNYVVCVSDTSRNSIPGILKKIKKDHIITIRNGVDIQRIDHCHNKTVHPVHIAHKPYVYFIYVARLIPIKNHNFIVDLIPFCSQKAKFIFVGLEDKNRAVWNHAKELNLLDRIEFCGLIPRESVFEKFFSSDVYLSASTLEGMPVSVLEALSCGLPAILSNIPQHREVFSECPDLSLIEFNKQKWVDEINRYVNMPEDVLRSIGKKCSDNARRSFSLNHMHDLYSGLFDSIIENK